MNESPRSGSSVTLGPKTVSPEECVSILAQAHAGRKLLEQSGIASSEHYIVSLQRGFKELNDLFHVATPFLFSIPIQTGLSHIIFIAPAFLIRQVGELHGF